MRTKVFTGAALWLVAITLLHVTLNVGWSDLAHEVRVMLGQERRTLYVGFLPVT